MELKRLLAYGMAALIVLGYWLTWLVAPPLRPQLYLSGGILLIIGLLIGMFLSIHASMRKDGRP